MFQRQMPRSALSRLAILATFSLMPTASARAADPPVAKGSDNQARVDSEMKSLGVPGYAGLEYFCWNVADHFDLTHSINHSHLAFRSRRSLRARVARPLAIAHAASHSRVGGPLPVC